MLVREGSKKLTNVSIVALKAFNRRYEVAVYPNKLFEYRHNQDTPLSEILHTPQIYRSVATGDLASAQDLSLFNLSQTEIVHRILAQGHEQKAAETARHELAATEREIVDLVQHKVTYNGAYVSSDVLLGFIRSVWDVKNEDSKKQIPGIVKRLEEIGFERISYFVRCSAGDVDFPGVEKTADGAVVRSDVLPSFVAYCESSGLKYVITKNEEVEEEEWC